MVLITAAVFTKGGKLLLSRQFVSEMTRARLEGLLDAFPKLVSAEKGQRQHTFIETDSVRYVYQPLDQIYMCLVTTKTSNILEDLETLRLFARIIPEYCRSNEESEILANAFELIFAFDEVVALGHRENVNLAQIRTFTEMDSHEERVFNQIQIAQQRAAKTNMEEKIKEMKRDAKKKAMGGIQGGGFGRGGSSAAIGSSMSSSSYKSAAGTGDFPTAAAIADSYAAAAKSKTAAGGGKAMKLGKKTGTVDTFVQQLRQEGQRVVDAEASRGSSAAAAAAAAVESINRESVHLKLAEKVVATVKRDGVLESAEIIGSVNLNITDPALNTVVIHAHNADKSGAQLQVHPHLDKAAWQNQSVLRLKNPQKPFPVNRDVDILKWRVQLKEESALPITLTVWPNEASNGCTVNIEYTLQREDLVLNGVEITVPLPIATAPVVSECEGNYEYLKSKNILLWTIPSVDESNKSGALEFEVPNGDSDHFFPVHVSFYSEQLYCPITVTDVTQLESEESVVYSAETRMTTEKYDIV